MKISIDCLSVVYEKFILVEDYLSIELAKALFFFLDKSFVISFYLHFWLF